jgi:hypothetical protein
MDSRLRMGSARSAASASRHAGPDAGRQTSIVASIRPLGEL